MIERMYYCLVSGQAFVFTRQYQNEDEELIYSKDKMFIRAHEAYNISTVQTPQGMMVQVGVMKHVAMNCDFISEIDESNPLYKIIKGKQSGITII